MGQKITLKRQYLTKAHSFNINVPENERLFMIWDAADDDQRHSFEPLRIPRDGVKIVYTGPPDIKGSSTMENVWAVITGTFTVELPE